MLYGGADESGRRGGRSTKPLLFHCIVTRVSNSNSFCSIPTFLTCHRSIAWLSLMPPPALAPHVAHTSTSNRAPGARPQSDMLSQPQAAAARQQHLLRCSQWHMFVEWVFLNITPHIAMHINLWTVWGF